MKKTFLTFDDGSLSSQGPFKLSIILPIAAFIILSIPLWLKTEFNFSAEGYANFLELYKLPIAALSLSIPLVAITSHIHRTIQTASQIEITNKKNDADRFFAHQKFITDNLSTLKSKEFNLRKTKQVISIETPTSLYRSLFPNCSYSKGINLDGHIDFIEGIKRNLLDISEHINLYKEKAKTVEHYHYATDLHYEFMVVLSVPLSLLREKLFLKSPLQDPDNNLKVMFDKNKTIYKLITPFHNEKELKDYLLKIVFMINHIFGIVSHDYLDDDHTSTIYGYSASEDLLLTGVLFTRTIYENKPPMYLKKSRDDDGHDNEYSMYKNILYTKKRIL